MPFGAKNKVIDFKEVKSKHRGTLSCCMIARDEEASIGAALASVRELADEVIVIDTGSRDGTALVAGRAGARVFPYDWNDDFSEARNFALSKATKEWILVLDADEAVDAGVCERIRSLLHAGAHEAYICDQRTYVDSPRSYGLEPVKPKTRPGGQAAWCFRTAQVRLFRADRNARYRGAIHEEIESSLREAGVLLGKTDITIHHLGRLRPSGRVYRKMRLYMRDPNGFRMRYPGNSRYLYEIAAQLLELGHNDHAADQAELGLTVDPRNWELLNILGLAHLRRGACEQAERYFKRAIRENGTVPDLHNNLGVAYMEGWELQEAFRCFDRGIELDGDHPDLLRNAASVRLKQGDTKGALECVARSLALDPFNAQSHVIHADLLLRNGEAGAAVDALDRIKFISGTSLKVYLRAIQLYVRMNELVRACDVLRMAMAANPANSALLLLAGKIHEMTSDDTKALRSYRKLLALEPESSEALNSIGCIYERRGMFAEALAHLRKASHLAPCDQRIGANIGIVLGKLGREKESERHLRGLIGAGCTFGGAYNALGCLLAGRGGYTEAASLFTRAVELEPANTDYHLNLGKVHERLKLTVRAREIHRKAVLADPPSGR